MRKANGAVTHPRQDFTPHKQNVTPRLRLLSSFSLVAALPNTPAEAPGSGLRASALRARSRNWLIRLRLASLLPYLVVPAVPINTEGKRRWYNPSSPSARDLDHRQRSEFRLK